MNRSTRVEAVLASIVLLVVSLVAGAVIAACGSGSASPDGSASANAEPIRVGVAVALSGPYAGDGQNSLQGIEMGIDEINAAGGVLGRQLKLYKFDLQDLAPERVMLGASTLIQQDKVDVVFAGWAGFGGDVQAFGKYPQPFFHCDAQQAVNEARNKGGFKNVYSMCPTEPDVADLGWQFVTTLPYQYPEKTVAFISGNDPWNEAVYTSIKQQATASGWKVLSWDKVPPATQAWGAIMTRVRNENPALIMVDQPVPSDLLAFLNEFKKQPTQSIVYLGMTLPIREFLDAAKGKADGVVGLTSIAGQYPLPPLSQGEQDWWTAYSAKFGMPPGGLAGNTYEEVRAWQQAVEAVGDPSKYDEVNQWLSSNSFQVWDGIDPMKFDADGQLDYVAMGYGQLQAGAPVTLVYGGQLGYTDYAGKSYDFQVPSWITQ